MKEEIQQALRALEVDGELETEIVLEAARSESSPLHSQFDWDDTRAAHQHRLNQAMKLIQRYRIVFVDSAQFERIVPGYVSVKKPDPNQPLKLKRVYVRTEVALTTPDLRESLLADLRRDVEILRKKYGHLQEFAEILQGVIDLEEE